MEGLSITVRAVCLSVVAVSLAVGSVPGAFGQALPTPAAPTLSNNSTTGGINVKIQGVAGATQYTVTGKKVGVASWSEHAPAPPDPKTGEITVTTAKLQGATSYNVTVQAQNSTSTSAESPATSIITLPDPPTNITGIGGLLKVTVSWTAAPGAASYQLTLSNGMSFTTTATSYVITGLQTATSYNLIMASIDSSGGRGIFSPAVVVRTANVATQ